VFIYHREKLQEQLRDYILQSVKYTETLKEFCDGESKWTLQRETELKMMRDIKDRAEQITLKFDHVQKSEDKAKALGEYILSNLTQFTADSRRQELEKELGEVLKNTLEGLEKLHIFLDAVEKLAVTSLFIFMGESFMPIGVRAEDMCSVISTARIVSPLLVHFKRDAGDFFLPSLSNVDVLALQLDKYIHITQQICEKMSLSHHKEFCLELLMFYVSCFRWKNMKLTLEFGWKSDESVQKLYSVVTQLIQIRKDESFRIHFLFSENAQDFISIFTDCGPRMLDFLSELEEAAVQLDNMKKGSHISTVAGSSVGIAGGVLSIVGLALAPVTAGVSLALTLTGVGLGVTSGVNGIVTGITEMAVNKHHGQNANNIFIRFMEDVQMILDCMEVAANTERAIDVPDGFSTAFTFGKITTCLGTVGKGIDAAVDVASAVKALSSEEAIAKAVAVGLQEANAGRSIPKLAADLPDVGQLAKGTPLALSNSARAGFVAVNALFIGLDLLFIVNSSINLAKGSKNEVAQIIRERSVLWCSEVKAWQKIHDQLCKGTTGFQKNLEILNQPF
ncbi:apolipoprotein L4, partial [Silurus asotus]